MSIIESRPKLGQEQIILIHLPERLSSGFVTKFHFGFVDVGDGMDKIESFDIDPSPTSSVRHRHILSSTFVNKKDFKLTHIPKRLRNSLKLYF